MKKQPVSKALSLDADAIMFFLLIGKVGLPKYNTLWNKSFNGEKIQPILIPQKMIPIG